MELDKNLVFTVFFIAPGRNALIRILGNHVLADILPALHDFLDDLHVVRSMENFELSQLVQHLH